MKRLVAMEDLSCLGKCSLTVILPVVSAMGVECAALPTAALSTHTAFPNPAVEGLSDFAGRTMEHWKTIGAEFDGILTGYLANPEQIDLARRLISEFGKDAAVVVDPAMADHGKLYAGLSRDMVGAMARLCGAADLILPNLTEGAMLAGMEYRETGDPGYCRELGAQLQKLGCGSVLLTGAEPDPGKIGFYWTDGDGEFVFGTEKQNRTCHGTGDLFAAVTAGGLLRGKNPAEAGALAAEFVRRCIAATPEESPWGVAFEGELGWLADQMR